MFRSHLTSRSIGWRLGVAAIACACLLGQVSALAHRVLVRHVTCAEHGESVHLGSVSGDGARQGSSLDRGVPEPVPRIADSSTVAADDHEHCSVLVFRSLTPRSQPDQALGPGPIFLGLDLPRDAVLGPVIAPYLVAPKTSPPRSAS